MSFVGDIFSGSKGAGFEGQETPLITQDMATLIGQSGAAYNQGQGINAEQAALAQALLAQSQGLGPNPAAAALQQATNNNQAMTAGTIAGTKGINPALAARQAAMAGSTAQQTSAAQGAQMQAQQQIAARQQLAGVNSQRQMATLAQQQMAQNTIQAQNDAMLRSVDSQNRSNSSVAVANAKSQEGILGGLGSAGMKALPLVGGLFGGKGKGGGGTSEGSAFEGEGGSTGTGDMGGDGGVGMTMAAGRVHAPQYAHGGEVAPSFSSYMSNRMSMKDGGKVPGTPAVPGKVDTQKNDTVAANLSPGEVVLPRSVMMSEDPAGEAAKFVAAVVAHSKMRK